MNPLFSTKSIIQTKESSPAQKKQSAVAEGSFHAFFVEDGYKDFAARLPELHENMTYHFVSFGQFSLRHVVFHLLTLTGTADVWSTTYGLGPVSARGIVDAMQKGMIRSFSFLYDWKIRTYKEEAHNICAMNFPVKITSIHAKATVIISDKWAVTVSGSANWSDSNRKIENIIISTDPVVADFYRLWIQQSINSPATEPAEIIKTLEL